jgi:hypothetical protein
MGEKKPQNLSNHTKTDPAFHWFLAPVGLILLIGAIYNVVKNPGLSSYAHLLAGFWAVVAVFKMRLYSLKVQDRLIRLEEQLRLGALLPEPNKSRIYELTEQQLIALRFASDGEIPVLVEKTLKSNLPPKAIKAEIQSWRPDYWRV